MTYVKERPVHCSKKHTLQAVCQASLLSWLVFLASLPEQWKKDTLHSQLYF